MHLHCYLRNLVATAPQARRPAACASWLVKVVVALAAELKNADFGVTGGNVLAAERQRLGCAARARKRKDGDMDSGGQSMVIRTIA